MILKLIQAGGFVGKPKVAEADLNNHPQALKEHIRELFSQRNPVAASNDSPVRDKEQYYLQYEGKLLQLDALQPNDDLKNLIEKMKAHLHFER